MLAFNTQTEIKEEKKKSLIEAARSGCRRCLWHKSKEKKDHANDDKLPYEKERGQSRPIDQDSDKDAMNL